MKYIDDAYALSNDKLQQIINSPNISQYYKDLAEIIIRGRRFMTDKVLKENGIVRH